MRPDISLLLIKDEVIIYKTPILVEEIEKEFELAKEKLETYFKGTSCKYKTIFNIDMVLIESDMLLLDMTDKITCHGYAKIKKDESNDIKISMYCTKNLFFDGIYESAYTIQQVFLSVFGKKPDSPDSKAVLEYTKNNFYIFDNKFVIKENIVEVLPPYSVRIMLNYNFNINEHMEDDYVSEIVDIFDLNSLIDHYNYNAYVYKQPVNMYIVPLIMEKIKEDDEKFVEGHKDEDYSLSTHQHEQLKVYIHSDIQEKIRSLNMSSIDL